jgi:hypothetical protein
MAAPHLPTLLLAICAVLGGCAEDEPVERKDDGDVICVGATPPASAWSASPGPLVDDAGAGGSASSVIPGPNTQPGAPAPVYTLEDFQPESCGYQAAYGLEPMIGMVHLLPRASGRDGGLP